MRQVEGAKKAANQLPGEAKEKPIRQISAPFGSVGPFRTSPRTSVAVCACGLCGEKIEDPLRRRANGRSTANRFECKSCRASFGRLPAWPGRAAKRRRARRSRLARSFVRPFDRSLARSLALEPLGSRLATSDPLAAQQQTRPPIQLAPRPTDPGLLRLTSVQLDESPGTGLQETKHSLYLCIKLRVAQLLLELELSAKPFRARSRIRK